ncbi:MAG: hypothetical protein U9R08_04275 [Nanoarchaeota archaeon]|nr:hypothetical protein [Nanoarchaeota archaeon]
MAVFPKIKRKVNSFLRNEEGKISKEKIIKAGVLLSIVAIGTAKSAKADCVSSLNANTGGTHTNHCNSPVDVVYDSAAITATGTHGHATHSNHASHGSHGHGGAS